MSIAKTPPPPYYAVIFSSFRTEVDHGYADLAQRMVELASQQEGFLGVESVRDGLGITVSYWRDLACIRAWHENAEHRFAQSEGYKKYYASFATRISKVERDYFFEK